MHYFLGIDIGGTKSHALIADETGRAVGFGQGGPGNHEVVGYSGLEAMLQGCHPSGIGNGRHRHRADRRRWLWRGRL